MKKILLLLLMMLVWLTACRQEEPVAYMLLYGEGAPAYSIVRSDTSDGAELEAALLLRNTLKNCGVELPITTDWKTNPISEYELVVGNTLRAETEAGLTVDPLTLGKEGYYVKVVGSRVYMDGGSEPAVIAAVEHFLTEFCGYTGEAEIDVLLYLQHTATHIFPLIFKQLSQKNRIINVNSTDK